MPTSDTAARIVTHRQTDASTTAIVFIHGFSGDPGQTWQDFPALLGDDPRLGGWDIHSVGYPSGFWLDLVGVWKADPPIVTLADGLRTAATLPPLDRYASFVLIAHSMGGLVAQRALVDEALFAQKVSHVFLFGTPSGGLVKASFLRFWKRQLEDMARGGPFIGDLRGRWNARFGALPPFRFWAVAGDQDEFVPRASSLEPFPEEARRVVPGDHLSIVHADTAEHRSAVLVREYLATSDPHLLASDPAAATAERQEAARTVAALHGRQGLDEPRLVQLALALEVVGRQDEAIELLAAQRRPDFLDATGALAGRYKRRWTAGGALEDGSRAARLYAEGFASAKAAGNAYQARYHGINVAFMALALDGDVSRARQVAQEVLGWCPAEPPPGRWALAAEGEAHLVLGDVDRALACYGRALTRPPEKRSDLLRQNLSMYQQAARVAAALESHAAAERLESLFRGKPS